MSPTPPDDRPVLLFEGPGEWEAWLEENHAAAPGVWLRLGKKGAGLRTLTYEEALDAALCWGWIDGQKRSWDAVSWIQKFTPRRPRSTWSRVNTGKVARLTESGRMRPPGLREVERAKADGRWDAAYDSPRNATVPDDLRAALDASPAARDAFAALSGANRYAVLWRVQTARKPETRAKRIRDLVAMLERGETPHP